MGYILVTGGAGYIGSHIVMKLIEKGKKVVIIDNLSKGQLKLVHPKAKFCKLGLKDMGSLNKIFKQFSVECVIHMAASSEVAESMADPGLYFQNNVGNTINLLEAMRNHNVKKIIFSSSAAVYGNPKKVPIEENHPTEPLNVYGLTKLMAEQILQKYHDSYKLNYIALRYFNAAGADPQARIGEMHEPETHLIPIMLRVARGIRKKLCIYGKDYKTDDGTCIRDYIHVNDLADAHIMAMEKIESIKCAAINLGTGKGTSIMKILEACKKVTGKDIDFEFRDRRPGDPAILVADFKLAKNLLGWVPKHDIYQILEDAWRWEKKR